MFDIIRLALAVAAGVLAFGFARGLPAASSGSSMDPLSARSRHGGSRRRNAGAARPSCP